MEQYLTETPVASLIFVFTVITSLYAFYNDEVYGKFMLHPYSISRGKRVFSLITSGLIHKDWMHLLMNMLSFYFFAFPLERTFVANSSWGHIQFALLYVLGLVLSDISSVIRHKNHFWYNSLGASGAVCAILFSYILFYPMVKMLILPIPFPIPAVIYGFLFLIYCVYAARHAGDSINHDAHFFGAVSGVIITIIYYPEILPVFFQQVFG